MNQLVESVNHLKRHNQSITQSRNQSMYHSIENSSKAREGCRRCINCRSVSQLAGQSFNPISQPINESIDDESMDESDYQSVNRSTTEVPSSYIDESNNCPDLINQSINQPVDHRLSRCRALSINQSVNQSVILVIFLIFFILANSINAQVPLLTTPSTSPADPFTARVPFRTNYLLTGEPLNTPTTNETPINQAMNEQALRDSLAEAVRQHAIANSRLGILGGTFDVEYAELAFIGYSLIAVADFLALGATLAGIPAAVGVGAFVDEQDAGGGAGGGAASNQGFGYSKPYDQSVNQSNVRNRAFDSSIPFNQSNYDRSFNQFNQSNFNQSNFNQSTNQFNQSTSQSPRLNASTSSTMYADALSLAFKSANISDELAGELQTYLSSMGSWHTQFLQRQDEGYGYDSNYQSSNGHSNNGPSFARCFDHFLNDANSGYFFGSGSGANYYGANDDYNGNNNYNNNNYGSSNNYGNNYGSNYNNYGSSSSSSSSASNAMSCVVDASAITALAIQAAADAVAGAGDAVVARAQLALAKRGLVNQAISYNDLLLALYSEAIAQTIIARRGDTPASNGGLNQSRNQSRESQSRDTQSTNARPGSSAGSTLFSTGSTTILSINQSISIQLPHYFYGQWHCISHEISLLDRFWTLASAFTGAFIYQTQSIKQSIYLFELTSKSLFTSLETQSINDQIYLSTNYQSQVSLRFVMQTQDSNQSILKETIIQSQNHTTYTTTSQQSTQSINRSNNLIPSLDQLSTIGIYMGWDDESEWRWFKFRQEQGIDILTDSTNQNEFRRVGE